MQHSSCSKFCYGAGTCTATYSMEIKELNSIFAWTVQLLCNGVRASNGQFRGRPRRNVSQITNTYSLKIPPQAGLYRTTLPESHVRTSPSYAHTNKRWPRWWKYQVPKRCCLATDKNQAALALLRMSEQLLAGFDAALRPANLSPSHLPQTTQEGGVHEQKLHTRWSDIH